MAITAKTSQRLADILRKAGFEELACRAERNEFHDFQSPHDMPSMELDIALVAIMKDTAKYTAEQREAARVIRVRHHDGDFDASTSESEEWAEGPEGQKLFDRLVRGT